MSLARLQHANLRGTLLRIEKIISDLDLFLLIIFKIQSWSLN